MNKKSKTSPKVYRFFFSVRLFIMLITWMFIVVNPGMGFATLNFAMMTNSTIDNIATFEGEFMWDKNIQATLFASYSYGALLATFIVAKFVDKYGVKGFLVIGTLINSVTLVVLPSAARTGGWEAVFVCRFVLGMGNSIAWPAIGQVAAKWSGPGEKSLIMGVATTGFALGPFLLLMCSGYICEYLGWPLLFYLVACLNALLIVLIIIYFKSDPRKSRWVSVAEKEYILTDKSKAEMGNGNSLKVPWRKLMSSAAVLVIALNGFAERTCQMFVLIFLPTYLAEAFGESIITAGIYSAIPCAAQVIGRILTGILADNIHFSRNENINVKIYNSLGFAGNIGLLYGLTLLSRDARSFVPFFVFLQFLIGSLYLGGYMRSALLFAPQYVGLLMSIGSGMGYLAAIVESAVVGALTPHGSLAEWSNAILFVIAVAAVALVLFALFGSTETPIWCRQTEQCAENKEKETFVLKTNKTDEI